jgi:alpha-tubulin suppressor-like RCC1 family protein
MANVSFVSGNASVSFSAPTDNGGNAITLYTITALPGNVTANASVSPVVVYGLTACSSYTFTAKAINSLGNGLVSNTSASLTILPFLGLYSWGNCSCGGLGLGYCCIPKSSPTQVGSLTNWLSLAAGYKIVMSNKIDGTLWAWGKNNAGQLGLGNTTNYSSPKQIGVLTNWSKIIATSICTSSGSSFGIKTCGTVWAWGKNNAGQLGLGNTTNYSSPKQIGSCTNWAYLAGPVNGASMFGIKTCGTLWAWGKNCSGQLGFGNINNYSSPKQVGALTNWSGISTSYTPTTLAVKTDGTLWSWGKSTYGNTGLGNTSSYSSPKQVGSCTNWASVSASCFSSLAVKTDGTLWSWGCSYYGASGRNIQGASAKSSSPSQVGALTNWKTASTGFSGFAAAALKTNGTAWAWGCNASGELGLCNRTSYSSPKQVGSCTTWKTIIKGNRATFGLHQ